MPVGTLIRPDNRLLSWSTGNFSLYGALPTVTVGAASAVVPDNPFVQIPVAQAKAPDAADAVAPPAVGIELAAVPDQAPIPLSPIETLPPAQIVPALANDASAGPFTPAVPGPTGSGSLAPITVASPSTVTDLATGPVDGGATSVAAQGGPVLAPVTAIADAGASPLSGLAPATLSAAIAEPLVGPNPSAGVLAAVEGLIVDSVGTVQPAVATAVTLADGLADTVAATIAPVADVAVAAVAAAVVPVAEIAVSAAAPVLDALAAGATAGPADAALGAVEPALAGTDPAGGVTTLVEMVEAADLFDLSQAGTDAVPVTAGGSILDALASDTLGSALLGAAADNDADDNGSLADLPDGLLGGL